MSEAAGNVTLVTGKNDQQRAQEFHDRIMPKLIEVCEIMSEARRDGIIINFALGLDQFGRQRVQAIDISKPLL